MVLWFICGGTFGRSGIEELCKANPSNHDKSTFCAKTYNNFRWPQDLLLRTTSPRLMDDSCYAAVLLVVVLDLSSTGKPRLDEDESVGWKQTSNACSGQQRPPFLFHSTHSDANVLLQFCYEIFSWDDPIRFLVFPLGPISTTLTTPYVGKTSPWRPRP
jgi:hypothetical protein